MKRAYLLMAIAWLASISAAWAQPAWPGDQAPEALLPVRDVEPNRTLLAAASERHEKVAAALAEYQQGLEAGEEAARKIKPLDVGKTFVVNAQLGRYGKLLALVGEPAGPELVLRHQHYFRQLADIRSRLKQLPAVQKALPRVLDQLKKRARGGLNRLKSVDAKIRDKKWDEAAQELFEVRDDLDELGFWFEGAEAAEAYTPFDERMQTILPNWWQWWREQNNAQIDQQRDAQAPNFSGLLAEVEQAVSAVAAAGKAAAQGQELAGPELFSHFVRRWQDVQLAALRARAIEWSRDGDQEGWDRTRTTAMETAQMQFSSDMLKALARLIEADAGRASPAEVRDLYGRYLAACADLGPLMGEEAIVPVLTPALDKLAAREPALQAEIAAYRTATADVLRWRQRSAAAAAKAYRAKYPALEVVFQQSFAKDAQHAGLISASDAHNGPRVLDPIPLIIRDASPRFLKKQVAAAHVCPIPGMQGEATSRYVGRCYATMPLQGDWSAQVASLRRDLLAERHAPLTFEAYLALDSAERGSFVAAGGQVTSYELQAVITRYLLTTEVDVTVFGLGKIPGEPFAQRFQQAMVACRLEPAWLAHKYFFVSLQQPQ